MTQKFYLLTKKQKRNIEKKLKLIRSQTLATKPKKITNINEYVYPAEISLNEIIEFFENEIMIEV